MVYFSVLVVYCFVWSGALDTSGVLQSSSIIPLAQHLTTILISPPFSTYKYTNRVRKPRAVDPREVTLNLTFNGSEKEVLAKLGESLGKLKHVCITAMETENIALQVFHSDGRLLSKEILGAMVDGDKIMLKEKEE